jgi:hypothetical protein
MVIDATNINRSMRMVFNDPCVNTCDASIDTSVDERTFLSARGLYRIHILLLLFKQNNVFSCTWRKNIIGILVVCWGLCHGVQSDTDDSKFLKFSCRGEVLPISVNRLAFIIFSEDKCVETTYELLILMT